MSKPLTKSKTHTPLLSFDSATFDSDEEQPVYVDELFSPRNLPKHVACGLPLGFYMVGFSSLALLAWCGGIFFSYKAWDYPGGGALELNFLNTTIIPVVSLVLTLLIGGAGFAMGARYHNQIRGSRTWWIVVIILLVSSSVVAVLLAYWCYVVFGIPTGHTGCDDMCNSYILWGIPLPIIGFCNVIYMVVIIVTTHKGVNASPESAYEAVLLSSVQ